MLIWTIFLAFWPEKYISEYSIEEEVRRHWFCLPTISLNASDTATIANAKWDQSAISKLQFAREYYLQFVSPPRLYKTSM